jgi:hypothetical protein
MIFVFAIWNFGIYYRLGIKAKAGTDIKSTLEKQRRAHASHVEEVAVNAQLDAEIEDLELQIEAKKTGEIAV